MIFVVFFSWGYLFRVQTVHFHIHCLPTATILLYTHHSCIQPTTSIFVLLRPLPIALRLNIRTFILMCSIYLLILQSTTYYSVIEIESSIFEFIIWVKVRTIKAKIVAFSGHNPWLRWKYSDSWARGLMRSLFAAKTLQKTEMQGTIYYWL